jgi:hypothetical protein
MHEHALMIKTVRDGPVCALILRGALDPGQTDGFLGQAVAAAGNRAGRLVLDPARVTFPGCAAVPAVATAASFAAARPSSARSAPGNAGPSSYRTWTHATSGQPARGHEP